MAGVRVSVRREEILRILDEQAEVSVNELARHFAVSAVTIRNDLAVLRTRGALRRVHGGARIGRTDEGGFGFRASQAPAQKRAIARLVAPTIRSGDTIALDSSSTAYYLARELGGREGITVVTSALRTAMWLSDYSAATVWLVGGVVRRASGSTSASSLDVTNLPKRIDKGFFSMNRISAEDGLFEVSEEEAKAKRRVVSVCRQIYALADARKFECAGEHRVVPIEAVAGIFTDSSTPSSLLDPFRARGIPLHVAYVSGDDTHAPVSSRLREVG